MNDPAIEAASPLLATVPAHAAGRRFDAVLAELFPQYSRSRLAEWIKSGDALLDGHPARPRDPVRGGEAVALAVVEDVQTHAVAEDIPLDILYEDASVFVIDKPAGLVVHPGAGNPAGTLVNALLHRDPALEKLPRAGIVHRLDKDTSGLMVVARTLAAQTALVRAIAAREVRREYLALVHGRPDAETFSVEAPIGRDPVARVRMAVVAGAKPARTDVTVLATAVVDGQTVSAVRCRLHTGRTHQIRVHLAHRGHPLLGDTLYGGRALLGVMRQALHATRLGLVHPDTGQALLFEAPVPVDLRAAWHAVTG